MESAAPELSAVCLPLDQHDRPIRPGSSVLELLELWGEAEEGPRESKGGWTFAGYHPGRVAGSCLLSVIQTDDGIGVMTTCENPHGLLPSPSP